MSQLFLHKEYYEGDTDKNNRNTDDSRFDNDNFVQNLYKEQEYKEDDEYKEDYSVVNKTNEFKMIESDVEHAHTKQLLSTFFTIKAIKSVIIIVNT